MNNSRKWASLVLILILITSLFISSFDAKVLADDGINRIRSQYETIIIGNNGHELVRGAFPAKPPKTRMPAVNLPQPPAAAASASSTDAGSASSASTASSPYVYIAGTTTVLTNVPAFDWSYGCSATAAAMLFGYYDRTGYNNMYAGPANGGVCPLNNSIWGYTDYPSVTCWECPLSATHLGIDGRAIKGHVDDYWIDYGNAGPDPYVDNWTEHTLGDCVGDYMGTSQSKYNSTDANTWFWWDNEGDPLIDYIDANQPDGCHGMKLFAESRGYTVTTNFSQYIKGQGTNPNKGFTFADFQAEINAGRPVIIQVTGHSMLGYGYDTSTSTIYIHDTWDFNNHTMTWGGTYNNGTMQHLGVTVLRLAAPPVPSAPTLTSPASSSNVSGTSIPFTWSASSGATMYWLSVTTTSGTPLFSGNVNNVTTYTVTGFPNNGTQYRWSVAAGNIGGWSPGASAITFTNGIGATVPSAPTLTSPASGSNVSGTSIPFSWSASSGATMYWLSVTTTSGTPLFSGNVNNVTTYTVTGFSNNGTQYRWSVAAGNSTGWGSGATPVTFTNSP